MSGTKASEFGPFGLYIHWPYCAAICPYCDFNVYRDRGVDRTDLVQAICDDIRGWRERSGPRSLTSLHFGGGTPSRLAAREIAAIVDAAAEVWPFVSDAEIGLEVNPEDADAALFAGFRSAGVNRVSLGVQAFDDRALAALGRGHSANSARAAIGLAQAAFERVSIDLIYAREGQGLAEWERELSDALRLGLEHLSLYQLAIESGTAFERRVARGELTPPDVDMSADLFELTQQLTVAASLPAYEVSNHAARQEAQSRHNLLYWRSHEWAGVGPGAHGRLGPLGEGRRALSAFAKPNDYIAAVSETGWGVETDASVSLSEQAREMLLMGLRINEGVSLSQLRQLDPQASPEEAVTSLEQSGLVALDGHRLRATPDGRLLTDRLALELAPD